MDDAGLTTPTYKAMKIPKLRRLKSTFGETSILASAPNPDSVAARRAAFDGRGLTVMVISKSPTGSTPATINLANFSHGGSSQVWQLTAANTITRLSTPHQRASFSVTLPPQSVPSSSLEARARFRARADESENRGTELGDASRSNSRNNGSPNPVCRSQ